MENESRLKIVVVDSPRAQVDRTGLPKSPLDISKNESDLRKSW